MSGRLVPDLDEAAYHSGPELSVSGAKLLRKSPALYRYRQDHPERKDVFDFGTVVHGLILGTGWPVDVIDADDWRGKAAREAKDAAHAGGRVPLLRKDYQRAEAICAAVKDHDLAGRILSVGAPEQSLYWTDDETGVDCRARVDWLNPKALADVKTCQDASPEAFRKSVANFGYAMQAHAYSAGHHAATGRWLPFLFIAVEKEPPYQVAVYDLDDEFLSLGDRQWRDALATFRACRDTDTWPGYAPGITTLTAPTWALRESA